MSSQRGEPGREQVLSFRIGNLIRENVLGLVALFVALSGSVAFGDQNIGFRDIQNKSIGEKHLRVNSVTAPAIERGAVGALEIAAGAVATELALVDPKSLNEFAGLVAKEADSGWIKQEDLANGSVDTGEIVDSGVTSADIDDGAVTGFDVLNKTLTAEDLADNILTAAQVADGSLTGDDILDGSLTGADIAEGSLSGDHIANNSLTSADIRDAVITGTDVFNDSLTAADIADGLGLNEIDESAIQARVSGSCSPGQAISAVAQTGTVTCVPTGGGGGPPTGSAGGDLDGSYPSPQIGTLPAAGFGSEPIILEPGVPAILALDPTFQYEDAMWESGNPTRITIQRTGVYQVDFQATGSNNGPTDPTELVLSLSFLLNGAVNGAVSHLALVDVIREGSGATEVAHGGGLVYLQAGQYLEVQGRLDGGAGSPYSSSIDATVQLHWLSQGQLP